MPHTCCLVSAVSGDVVCDCGVCCAGGSNFAVPDYVEYDLDNEDEDWLQAFNRTGASSSSKPTGTGTAGGATAVPSSAVAGAAGGAVCEGGEQRLSDVRLERMLWRLELAWAESVEASGTNLGV
jgi:hypothetical protein